MIIWWGCCWMRRYRRLIFTCDWWTLFFVCRSWTLLSVHSLSWTLSDDITFCLLLVDIEDRQVDVIGVAAVRWCDGVAVIGSPSSKKSMIPIPSLHRRLMVCDGMMVWRCRWEHDRWSRIAVGWYACSHRSIASVCMGMGMAR